MKYRIQTAPTPNDTYDDPVEADSAQVIEGHLVLHNKGYLVATYAAGFWVNMTAVEED